VGFYDRKDTKNFKNSAIEAAEKENKLNVVNNCLQQSTYKRTKRLILC
jgi:dTDP-4-dehydrorhamnose reductase